MAYVESYYLDANANEQEDVAPETLTVLPQQHEPYVVEIKKVGAAATEPVSDYCGFVDDELPLIYRQQIRQAAVSQMSQVSQVAATPAAQTAHGAHSNHEYLIGFSAPKQSDVVHTRRHHELPKMRSVTATTNVYRLNGANWIKGSNYEQSKYLVMEDENFDAVNAAPPTSELASTTGSSASTISTHTAPLGPAFGCIATSPKPAARSYSAAAEKYRGLSAFRPVGEIVQSQYAYPELN